MKRLEKIGSSCLRERMDWRDGVELLGSTEDLLEFVITNLK